MMILDLCDIMILFDAPSYLLGLLLDLSSDCPDLTKIIGKEIVAKC